MCEAIIQNQESTIIKNVLVKEDTIGIISKEKFN